MNKFIFFTFFCLLFFQSCIDKDGCTNETALNYDPAADQDDGTCLYSLAVPEVYQFQRGDSSSVFYEAASVRNLLINDLDIVIGALGETGAVSIEVAGLQAYYETVGLENAILTPTTGFSGALQTTFGEITATSLIGGINNNFGARDSITSWLNIIATNTQNTTLLESEAVYTQANGIDLREMVKTTLWGAVIYSNAVQSLNSVEDATSNSLVSNTNYTEQEHTWDLLTGYIGAARNYGFCSDTDLANPNFAGKDLADSEGNLDNLLDWTAEYSFGFARMAGERDVAVVERDFSKQLFSLLLRGRTAVTNKNQVETDASYILARDSLDLVLEQLIAATLISKVNKTLEEMTHLGTTSENISALNREWSGMLGMAQMLWYRNTSGDTPLDSDNLIDILDWIGDSPNYSIAGTAAYLAYQEDLEMVKNLLKMLYGFSDAELEEW